jgi:hypothetical protein
LPEDWFRGRGDYRISRCAQAIKLAGASTATRERLSLALLVIFS